MLHMHLIVLVDSTQVETVRHLCIDVLEHLLEIDTVLDQEQYITVMDGLVQDGLAQDGHVIIGLVRDGAALPIHVLDTPQLLVVV